MSLSTFQRPLRIGHGELRTEIPSYGVTDREWSRIPWGRVSSWEARKLYLDKTACSYRGPRYADNREPGWYSAFTWIVLNAYSSTTLPRDSRKAASNIRWTNWYNIWKKMWGVSYYIFKSNLCFYTIYISRIIKYNIFLNLILYHL